MDEGQNPAGGSDDDVGAVLRETLLVFLDGHSPKEDRYFDIVHVFGEAFVLLADLES